MTVFLVAGKVNLSYLEEIIAAYPPEKNSYVGVDRGTYHLMVKGILPKFGVGDFDSLTLDEKNFLEKKGIPLIPLPTEKDDTDTQQALLKCMVEFPNEKYVLLGGTGGRLDHFLGNLYLPLETRFRPILRQFSLWDEQNVVTFYEAGEYTIQKIAGMSYLGYVGLTPFENLTLEKSKYTLNKQSSDFPFSYPSNEFVEDEAMFSFTKGILAVIQSRG